MRASYDEIHASLTAAGEFFEIENVEVRGVRTRAWKNALPHLGSVLAQGAANAGDRPFFVHDDERLSHREHFLRVQRLAGALVDELGVQKGDRIAIVMRNLPEWSIAFFASALAGAVAVAINAFGTGDDLAFAIQDADARVVIADGERLERLLGRPGALVGRAVVGTRLHDRKGTDRLPGGILPLESLLDRRFAAPSVSIEPDDPATLFYTSGTSSRPKGVLGTHRNICTNLMSMMFAGARNHRREEEPPAGSGGPMVNLLAVPLFHATGCHSIMLSQAYFGGTLVLLRRWDPEVALDLMEREKVTAFTGVPTMLWDLLNSPSLADRDLRALRNLGGGGAASPPELIRRIREHFPHCGSATGYGLTETSSLTASISGTDLLEHPTSVGVPVPTSEIRIVDADTDVPPGATGEIWIKGPHVAVGYWQRPEETSETFTDGWLHTGDIGRVDDDGFLYILDRAKDLVIRGGENISTLEVESALFEHPDVLEAAVFATPHATLGEAVGAVVRLRDGATTTPEELRSHCAARLAGHKVPATVWLATEPLPRGDTGKLLKRAIQADLVAAAAITGRR